MEITDWIFKYREPFLSGRYITLDHINPLLKKYEDLYDISVLGESELGKNIYQIKMGHGKKRVLAWSQMHGNESTTTKAIFDFLYFLQQKVLFKEPINEFYENCTVFIIPMLNPDGASLYTRENANSVDLNRDAQNLTQKESKILKNAFETIQPDLCLNLHGQRTIYGLDTNLPATVSFLTPAANEERSITDARKISMQYIAQMNKVLQERIPGQIGRYDDSFNNNCFGDYFQMQDVPVILFEAGHYDKDYNREYTRKCILLALMNLFGFVPSEPGSVSSYFEIPENNKNYCDILLRDVLLGEYDGNMDIAIQFTELLDGDKIKFIPKVNKIGKFQSLQGHYELDAKGEVVLINSQQNIKLEDEILTIDSKSNDLLINFINNTFFNNNII